MSEDGLIAQEFIFRFSQLVFWWLIFYLPPLAIRSFGVLVSYIMIVLPIALVIGFLSSLFAAEGDFSGYYPFMTGVLGVLLCLLRALWQYKQWWQYKALVYKVLPISGVLLIVAYAIDHSIPLDMYPASAECRQNGRLIALSNHAIYRLHPQAGQDIKLKSNHVAYAVDSKEFCDVFSSRQAKPIEALEWNLSSSSPEISNTMGRQYCEGGLGKLRISTIRLQPQDEYFKNGMEQITDSFERRASPLPEPESVDSQAIAIKTAVLPIDSQDGHWQYVVNEANSIIGSSIQLTPSFSFFRDETTLESPDVYSWPWLQTIKVANGIEAHRFYGGLIYIDVPKPSWLPNQFESLVINCQNKVTHCSTLYRYPLSRNTQSQSNWYLEYSYLVPEHNGVIDFADSDKMRLLTEKDLAQSLELAQLADKMVSLLLKNM